MNCAGRPLPRPSLGLVCIWKCRCGSDVLDGFGSAGDYAAKQFPPIPRHDRRFGMPNLCRPITFRRICRHGRYGSRLLRQALVENNLGQGTFRGPLHRLHDEGARRYACPVSSWARLLAQSSPQDLLRAGIEPTDQILAMNQTGQAGQASAMLALCRATAFSAISRP